MADGIEGRRRKDPYLRARADLSRGRNIYEHRALAERALGRRLPDLAEVHHVNEDKKDNRPENLVICQDAAFHRLLHTRTKALRACGNPAWRKCEMCKTYDAVENLYFRQHKHSGISYRHRACHAAYMLARKKARFSALASSAEKEKRDA